MKRRAVIATLAAGASMMRSPLCRSAGTPLPISFYDAITIALREMERRGLTGTHHVAALHGAPNATAEGAVFAASIFPRFEAPPFLHCDNSARLKFSSSAMGESQCDPGVRETEALLGGSHASHLPYAHARQHIAAECHHPGGYAGIRGWFCAPTQG